MAGSTDRASYSTDCKKKKEKTGISDCAAVSQQQRKKEALRQKHGDAMGDEDAEVTLDELFGIEIKDVESQGFMIYGDEIFGEEKGDGVMRLMAQNQDKFGSWTTTKDGYGQTENEQRTGKKGAQATAGKTTDQSWSSWKAKKVDVLLLGDTGWQDPVNVTQPALQSAGKATAQMKQRWRGQSEPDVDSAGVQGEERMEGRSGCGHG
jgi:hypothetical protein